ncbi:MAG TPA: hypothetical protein VGU68_20415 [Ktedonobacteraceae bacterium]|nr:hypothetical protein [Ktedonobacteraceae bacterium]
MKYSTQMLFADVIEDESPEDEIDQLFSQLLQIEPPPTLVDDILASIAHLPLPQKIQLNDIEDLEGFAFHNNQQLS